MKAKKNGEQRVTFRHKAKKKIKTSGRRPKRPNPDADPRPTLTESNLLSLRVGAAHSMSPKFVSIASIFKCYSDVLIFSRSMSV